MPNPTDQPADVLVSDARHAVHEALVSLPAWEADRVRSLLADLETAVEGRTAIRCADASAVRPPATERAAGASSGSLESSEASSSKTASGLNSGGQPALRDAIRRAVCEAEGFAWDSDMLEPDEYGEAADAVLAVLPTVDRAAVLSEAERTMLAYALDQAQERIWSEGGFTDEDQAAVTSLRRLADEPAAAAGWVADDTQPETRLAEARATNRRLNLRAQRLESELAAYRRAVRQWEVSERGTYIPHSSLRAIGKACGVDVLGSHRHLKHFERVEQAEAAIERVRRLHDNLAAETALTSPDDEITRGAAARKIAAALDGERPVVVEQPDTQETLFVPPVHYRRDDGVDCCVHTIPVGPDSCRHCRELAE